MKKWWNEEADTFNKVFGDGDTFTNGEIVLSNLGLLAIMLAVFTIPVILEKLCL